MQDFEDALDKIALGEARPTTLMTERQKKIVSIHEAGHTLVALNIGDYDKVKKVTIIPRGMAGGVTVFEPNQERVDSGLYSREYLENQLCVALGGRAAEDIIFGRDKITTGASSDFVQVNNIARKMVMDFGFTETLGPVAWRATEGMGANTGYSETTAYQIDEEVKRIVFHAYERTKNILNTNKKSLKKLAHALIEQETMTGEQVIELLDIQAQ
jgi:cell division protease FtsH